jgi:hypothetical protein
MKRTILILFFTILSQNISFSQDTSIVKFLPLKTGNIWVYHCYAFNINPPCYCSRYYRIKIVGTNVINGKTYFQSQLSSISQSCSSNNCGEGLLPFDSLFRVDTLSGKILRYAAGSGCLNTPNEILLDSLKAHLYDTIWIYCQPPLQWNTYVCSDTSIINIFGLSIQSRGYSMIGFEGGWSRKYVKGIGLSNSSGSALWCNSQTSLLGCVIDGIVYGDTSFIVGINQISDKLPDIYSIYQNYPNPFNPATKIKFQIAKLGGVQLKIYDILGREVATLVNEKLQPGTYEVEFDGSNYPSGVYFYKLETENFSQTKKLVLLK